MDAQVLAIGKLFIACLLIGGGIIAIFIGSRLYLKGVGLDPDGTVLKLNGKQFDVNASLKSVGSVVMATSVAWGALGYLASPVYKQTLDGFTLASVATPEEDAVTVRWRVPLDQAEKVERRLRYDHVLTEAGGSTTNIYPTYLEDIAMSRDNVSSGSYDVVSRVPVSQLTKVLLWWTRNNGVTVDASQNVVTITPNENGELILRTRQEQTIYSTPYATSADRLQSDLENATESGRVEAAPAARP